VEVLEEVTAPQKLKKVLKTYDPVKRTVYQGRGHKVRAMFDRDNLPRKEQAIRNRIKREGFWMR
jgi:16S rRNA U516 pseudouridylate synthase RsuA-like enzyme